MKCRRYFYDGRGAFLDLFKRYLIGFTMPTCEAHSGWAPEPKLYISKNSTKVFPVFILGLWENWASKKLTNREFKTLPVAKGILVPAEWVPVWNANTRFQKASEHLPGSGTTLPPQHLRAQPPKGPIWDSGDQDFHYATMYPWVVLLPLFLWSPPVCWKGLKSWVWDSFSLCPWMMLLERVPAVFGMRTEQWAVGCVLLPPPGRIR